MFSSFSNQLSCFFEDSSPNFNPMENLNVEELLIFACSIVVLSYIFSIVSRYVRVPSVLLLLFAGIGFRFLADESGWKISFPDRLVESLGVVGLIMIVLEAG